MECLVVIRAGLESRQLLLGPAAATRLAGFHGQVEEHGASGPEAFRGHIGQ